MNLRLAPSRALLIGWLALLLASHLVRLIHPVEQALDTRERAIRVPVIDGERRLERSTRLAWLDLPPTQPAGPTFLVLHGSPGDNGQVRPFSQALSRAGRVIAPDLPGFGASGRRLPDYSIAAHAHYVAALLDSLGIERVHLVGYSMGGGVGLHLTAMVPERVASLVLVASIGVQEYELLGDYHLNHAVHGLQLLGLWAVRELVPHFGWLDDVILSVEYAKNFYHTDQRPLRELLSRWEGPTLILQGTGDVLVPAGIAQEHARLVPQSEVRMVPLGHFMVFTDAAEVAGPVANFVQRVERGEAPSRAEADPARRALAARPFDPSGVPRPTGFAQVVLLVLLAAATLVSEDLTCIAAGLLVSRGTLGFFPATLACLVGITIGDLLLFLAGRALGRPAIRRAPLRWLITEADLIHASRWFNRRGPGLVLATRFMPGTRLATYVSAGVLRTSLVRFAAAFVLAASLWTPLLVGGSALLGGQGLDWIAGHRHVAGPILLLSAFLLLAVIRVGVGVSTWRGRRLLYSRLRRITRWEFWPLWAFYPPVALYILGLGLKHRSLRLFTCANPAIPGGGLIGESKHEILHALGGEQVAPTSLIPANLGIEERIRRVDDFLRNHELEYPVVLKPDVGERGSGVAFPIGRPEARRYLAVATDDVLVQAFVPGHEFGVFYFRLPGQAAGSIFAITDKRLLSVTGDGHRTLERLILEDPRAVCSARYFLALHAESLDRVPHPGEIVPLTRLGTHSRGAMFLDGGQLATADLTRSIDAISRRFAGFYFGRYDLRAPSAEALAQGGPLTVIELNGVSAEATSIYDPRHGLGHAYRTLFAQWRHAFRIGAANRARGAEPTSWRELITLFRRHRRATWAHVRPEAAETTL